MWLPRTSSTCRYSARRMPSIMWRARWLRWVASSSWNATCMWHRPRTCSSVKPIRWNRRTCAEQCIFSLTRLSIVCGANVASPRPSSPMFPRSMVSSRWWCRTTTVSIAARLRAIRRSAWCPCGWRTTRVYTMWISRRIVRSSIPRCSVAPKSRCSRSWIRLTARRWIRRRVNSFSRARWTARRIFISVIRRRARRRSLPTSSRTRRAPHGARMHPRWCLPVTVAVDRRFLWWARMALIYAAWPLWAATMNVPLGRPKVTASPIPLWTTAIWTFIPALSMAPISCSWRTTRATTNTPLGRPTASWLLSRATAADRTRFTLWERTGRT